MIDDLGGLVAIRDHANKFEEEEKSRLKMVVIILSIVCSMAHTTSR